MAESFSEMLRDENSGAVPQTVSENVNSLSDILGGIWDAATPAFSLGAEEISRVLFNADPIVFHGNTFPEHEQQQDHGLPVQAQAIEPMQQEQDHGMER